METKFIYKNEKTREISFPLGGIGTGCIGLGGNGRLLDWEIFNRPNKGSVNGFSHFAVKAVRGDQLISAKVLNGDLLKDLAGQYSKSKYSGYGYGPSIGTMAGFPHFSQHTFTGEFPIARIDFQDDEFPGNISLLSFNPFIPLDDKASSIPAAFFEIEVKNTNNYPLTYTVELSVTNCFPECGINKYFSEDDFSGIVLGQNRLTSDEIGYGDITIATDYDNISYQEYWHRGGAFEAATVFWENFCDSQKLTNRVFESSGAFDTATLAATFQLESNQVDKVRFVITWNFPNQYNYWNPCKETVHNIEKDVIWKNYYSTIFHSSAETAAYCMKNWNDLFERTLLFKNALFSSTLPTEVIDAVSANLSVLKSPTVMRLEDGSFYGWEGVHEQEGSCEGNCSHVWNYAYALPFLFPNLERSMRDLDFKYNQWDNGRMFFRLQLPLGRKHDFEKNHPDDLHPCVDGQMGAIIKTYRDWKLCGDDEWLKNNWHAVKKALEYAWHEENEYRWDRDKDGIMEGRQHHTLDMQLFSPSSWLQSFYLAGLKAAAEMAEYLEEFKNAGEYRKLYENGKIWCENNLFNGEYFCQKIDLKDKPVIGK